MRPAPPRPTRRRRRRLATGFSLAEVLIASAILAFAAAALSQAVLSAQAHTYHGLHEAKAISLLQSTLDEVLSRPYADPDGDTAPGPDAGESLRTSFDALDDYHGFVQDAGQLTDAHNRPLPAPYQRFARSVTVTPMNTGHLGVLGTDADGVNVVVTVVDDQGQSRTTARFVPESSLVAGSAPRASTRTN